MLETSLKGSEDQRPRKVKEGIQLALKFFTSFQGIRKLLPSYYQTWGQNRRKLPLSRYRVWQGQSIRTGDFLEKATGPLQSPLLSSGLFPSAF